MIDQPQRRIFASATKAILHIHAQGIEKAKPSELETLQKVSDLILIIIHEMSACKPLTQRYEWVRTILEQMHPNPDYSFTESAIRDLADIGVTLARLLEGKHRSDATKIMDAQMFCDFAGNGIKH